MKTADRAAARRYDRGMRRRSGALLAAAMLAAAMIAAGCGSGAQICQLEPLYGLGIQIEPVRPPFVPGTYRLQVTADGVTATGEFDGTEWAAAEADGLRETLE